MSDEQNIKLYNHFSSIIYPSINNMMKISRYLSRESLQDTRNPLVDCGLKVYSQNDEDGITFEILRRLNLTTGVFAEFGVGNGTENNTLALVAAGWSGFWVGGEDLSFDCNPNKVMDIKFHYRKSWIKKSNIFDLYKDGLQSIRKSGCDLISLDLDGNDYHFVRELLSNGACPDVFIVEYNGKYAPPIEFVIDYDDNQRWDGTDYFGASLVSFCNLFAEFGYFLSCCNVTGANAFFIKNKHLEMFSDIPTKIEKLYASPKYMLLGLEVSGHPISLKSIQKIFKNLHAS